MKTLSRQKYIAQYPVVKLFLSNHPSKSPCELAGIIAVATNCPIIIVCQFLGEIVGWSDELVIKFNNLKLFYRIDDVV